ncbi:hypothetical protein AB2B41_18000 [Marimonas sp. MJW-29]|uniref:Lipoprotein n=1 Tax=Sulfitobacter sediminis TaxID=3234186 RepID=A0ABV3RRG2_9RHOB
MKLLPILAMALGSTLAANAAQAANCAQRDAVVKRLETKYSEKLIARGLQSKTALMELFGSPDTGTFTVLITNPNGVSCVVGAGTHLIFEEIKPEVAGSAS